jgi:hypothetical protein
MFFSLGARDFGVFEVKLTGYSFIGRGAMVSKEIIQDAAASLVFAGFVH